uniref:DUF5611 domain-containing protein n=1 Tax=Archaeoglobus fulgidus TaxID=2234 RepID=A0A7J2TJV7_ARCFL
MRDYKFKRGYKASKERLEEMLEKHFGGFEVEGEFYIVRNFGGIEEMKLKLSDKKLLVETKTRVVDDETALKTIKTYNRFLEELTGYTAKERQKMLRKEVESV